jgi:DNA-binding transcriptional ArsR family regulator
MARSGNWAPALGGGPLELMPKKSLTLGDSKAIFGIVPATDPTAIRALAHPLRLDLLELLAAGGPATAAQCGRGLGASQASCSFHLRQLAKYGYVEEAEAGPDRRERRWRLVPQRVETDARTPAVLAGELSRLVVDREVARFTDYLGRLGTEAPDWREAAGGHASMIQVTSAEAAGIRQRFEEILAPFEERAAASGYQPGPGQRIVHYFMTATPRPETTPPETTPPEITQGDDQP